MEDHPDAERLHVHAQHDHTTKVGNNQTERVDAHQVQSVGGSRSVEVAGHQKHEVGGSMNLDRRRRRRGGGGCGPAGGGAGGSDGRAAERRGRCRVRGQPRPDGAGVPRAAAAWVRGKAWWPARARGRTRAKR